MAAIKNRYVCRWKNETWFESDATSITAYHPRSTWLDLTAEATSLEDAHRRSALSLARTKDPNHNYDLELIPDDVIVPGGSLAPHKTLTVELPGGNVELGVEALTVIGGHAGKAVTVRADLQTTVLLNAELQQTLLNRQARGSASGRSRRGGGASLTEDDFDDEGIRTGRVSPIRAVSFSKPDDILVGISGPWKPDFRSRLTALRVGSDLSGVDDTILDVVVNGVAVPDVFIILLAGAIDAQTIVYDVVVNPGDRVQIRCTQSGGHTQVNAQLSAAPAI